MAIVILLDQRQSRSREDLVGEWSQALNEELGPRLLLPFTRTSGDEMQALLGPGALGTIVRRALASGDWWIGIGAGEVEQPLPADTREGRGPAFWNARQAIEQAKTRRETRPVSVVAEDEVGQRLTQCLDPLAFVITRRTGSQREAAAAYFRTGTVQAAARELGMSVQGARKNVLAAGCDEEIALGSLVDWIADPVATP